MLKRIRSDKYYAFIFLAFFSGSIPSVEGQGQDRLNELRNFISNRIPVVSQNWEIHQSPVTRFIYFANSAGLIEYNGISARTYSMPFRQGVRSVYVNNKGIIFTGSFEDFGYWDRDNSGGLIYHSLTEGVKVSKNDEIWNIYELNDVVYFQSFTTVYAYNYSEVSTIGCPGFMLFFFRVGDNFIAQCIGSGLYWFDGKAFTFIRGSELFSTYKVHAIIEFKFNEYWICTANEGIYVFDGHSFALMKAEISDYLIQETCNAGLLINDSLVVFGTILKGVVICDRKGDVIKSFDYSTGLKNNTVLSLFKDADNGLWAGLDEGVSYINLFSHLTYYANTSGNLGTVYAAVRDSNHLYLGTNHGLFAAGIEATNNYYSFNDLTIIPGTQGQVWKLAQFNGQILCGHNDGTFIVEGMKARKISTVTGGWSVKPYGDLLLEGTYTGIVSFIRGQNGQWRYHNRIEGFIEPTRFIEVDYLGYIWAVHPQKGIYRLELNERIDSVTNIIYFRSVAADTTGRITMSSINNQVVFLTSEYIYAFDYENKTFFPLKSLAPGLGEYVRSTQIIHFQKNSYWFILGNRIALFNITRDLEAEKILEFMHEYAELPWREQQIVSLDANTLLIPTRQAFATFNLDILRRKSEVPPPQISRMIFSGKGRKTVLFPSEAGRIRVPARENNLTVFIADPARFDEDGKEYWYRITELGEQWYSTSLDNFSFLNLRFGNYHLQVRAAGGKDVREMGFAIRRPGYISIAAILIYMVALAGIAFAGVRIFRHELNRHRKLLEYEVGKSKLESELDYKSYELMLTMRYLIRKTDVLRELHEKLDVLKTYSSRFPVKYIREMERIIDHGLDTQTEEWQNVMKNLKLSQEGFFRKLKEKYPSLTPNDLRLCSYLRMNFTTKEIANLINISSRAVEIGRYRLRQKMHLDHDVNLTEFLIKEAENI